jgi:elongation factor G
MFNKYKIKIELQPPKIAYRETICKRAKASGRYKKQSGGHGQFGDVVMTFEPSGDRGIPYIFEEQIVGGVVPGKYIPAVEKGVEESVKKGLLAGYPVIGIRAVLTDGSFHPVDSSDNAFTMAAIMAFKEAYMQAEPILLEPIAAVRIFVPARYTGDVISELKSRRARIMGMVPDNERDSYIEADIPMSELDGYMTSLRSISGGYGTFEYQFSRYGQAPEDITRKQAELFKNS